MNAPSNLWKLSRHQYATIINILYYPYAIYVFLQHNWNVMKAVLLSDENLIIPPHDDSIGATFIIFQNQITRVYLPPSSGGGTPRLLDMLPFHLVL